MAGVWRIAGALLFSMVNSLQLWMQVLNIPIPSEIAVMMPYILTIIVLVLTVSRVRSPSALTKPFDRGRINGYFAIPKSVLGINLARIWLYVTFPFIH